MREPVAPTPFADVNQMLAALRARIQAILGSQFSGMYLSGSLALGDFDLRRSDIDFLVVTDSAIDTPRFERLQQMHAEFAASGSPWADRIEAIYARASALRDDTPGASPCPQLEKGTPLFRAPLDSGWVFHRLTLRDHSLVIAGPDPRPLIGTVHPQAIRAAAAEVAGTWKAAAAEDPSWLPWLRLREAQAFVVLTLCRLLYSLATGSVASKPGAGEWAQQELAAPWTSLIEHTLAQRHEAGSITRQEEAETLAFLQFTLGQATGN
jgi:hypothetical protein